jgi:hypothetical protein
MNCEMAQRVIALAALAPAHNRQTTSSSREAGLQSAGHGDARRSLDAAKEFSEAEPFEEMLAGDALLADAVSLSDEGLDALAFGEAEVAENELLALDEHLSGCRECQAEMAATAAFYRALSGTRQPEDPTPSLLARARMRLDATLDSNAHQSAVAHLLQQLSFSAGRLRASPGLASGLLLLGLSLGGYGGYRAGQHAHNVEQGSLMLEPAAGQPPVIEDVTSIERDPASEWVEVRYDRLVPDAYSGSLDDPSIRRLLVFAMEHGVDTSVRNNSFDLLASECRQGHACNGGPVRNALLRVLHTDRKPHVRLEALDGLEPYIAEDMEVRDAVVRAMMADASAEVRIEAIRLLTPVEVDSSVRQALHTVASEDGDPLIRSASQQMLNGMPAVQ